ncbi:MAG: S41 family peptidase [Thermoanaerobaculia bacterium]
MKRAVFLLALAAALPLRAVDINDTRLLNTPAVSANAIAFSYANDIWTANLDGTGVRHLTTHPGVETGPRFSPDGSMIAFTGQYEGNTDVYVVPTAGGVPTRLTWHPANDVVQGFTPDGKSILFSSPREVFSNRYQQLFTVPVTGGAVTKLPIPNAAKASYSPDGRTIAYVPLGEPTRQWKHYRGGSAARILLFDTTTYAVEQVPQPATFANDTDPSWIGDKLYFRSDRDGEYNLYSFDRKTKQVSRLTNYTDFPVSYVSAQEGKVAFEQAGYLHLFDAATSRDQRLKIGVAADLAESRPRFVKGAKFIRNASLSPSGARAVMEFRGEIVTVPAEKGDDRDITQSPGVNDRSPIWSPDGKSIAWLSDEGGEYALRIEPQVGHGDVRTIKLEGAGFYYNPKWSPDSTKVSYVDNARALYVVDVPSSAIAKVSQNPYYAPGDPDLDHAWSADSKWLAYTRNNSTYFHTIYLYSVDQKKSFAVTDGYSDARYPVFDPNGKYLYFASSTNAGPVADWFALSNHDAREMSSIYLAVLPKGVTSPLAKESDEEEAKKEDAAAANGDKKPADTKADAKADTKKPAAVTVDFDGLSQRIIALPIPPAIISDIQVAKTGEIVYTKATNPEANDPDFALCRFDLTKRKEDTLLDKLDSFEMSRDGKHILVKAKDKWSIADYADKIDMSKRPLAVDAITVKIDPLAERKEMFEEAWRINRDYFYDPNMHGVNWKAVHDKYAALLPDVAVREDLYRIMQGMASELAVGHSYFNPAPRSTRCKPSRAVSSAPTTRSRTAAIVLPRCSVVSTGTPICAHRSPNPASM